MSLIRSDEYRLSGKNESSLKLILKNFHPFKNSVLFWLRLSQYREGWLFWFCRFMHLYASKRYHVQISPLSKIGYGFFIGHGISMIVNSGTTIGNNVNLSQFLNIGTNHETPAIIGDNVYIGPMVCIVEDVKIGSNSTIGAGAVVTKDVPENATVVGVPAKVLNYNDPGRYIINRFEVE
ncbi:MAG: serine acetyltransferase [Paludibacteraceae bacterium]|nr:serine acetyltransferase [Paludibacteraceae bacterium]